MRLLVIPQWFGSGAPDAKQIAAGGRLLADRLGVEPADLIDLPVDVDDAMENGIRRFAAIRRAAELVSARLAALAEPPLLVGAECGIEWAAVGSADRTRTAVVWFDAHPDLNTPATSPSGSFHGMVLRRLIDEGLPAGNVVLAGTRSFDDAERRAAAEMAIPTASAASVPTEVLAAVEAIDPQDVWIHVDLDVLDPAEFASVGYPEPGGLSVDALLAAIGELRSRWPVAGAAVTEFSPGDTDVERDLSTVLRIVAALRQE